MIFVARTDGDAAALLDPMQEAIWALDSLQTVYRAATLQELVAKSVAARRFNLWLLGTFAVVALTLAAIGLYGVVSYSTRTRFHEFGGRMAAGGRGAPCLLHPRPPRHPRRSGRGASSRVAVNLRCLAQRPGMPHRAATIAKPTMA
jgi:hypothetical protein